MPREFISWTGLLPQTSGDPLGEIRGGSGMKMQARWLMAFAGASLAATLSAQDPAAPTGTPESTVEDVIVVTASRTEQALNDAPAAITVLDQQTIESIPADDYGDLLRNVPGLNVAQTSARDINISSRGATN